MKIAYYIAIRWELILSGIARRLDLMSQAFSRAALRQSKVTTRLNLALTNREIGHS